MRDDGAIPQLPKHLSPNDWAILIHPGNAGKVKDFFAQVRADALREPFTVGGRAYYITDIVRGTETAVGGATLEARAKENAAYLGEEHGRHLLAHQAEIPPALRGQVAFVFPDWRDPNHHDVVHYVSYLNGCWLETARFIDDGSVRPGETWTPNFRLLSYV